MNTSYDKFTEKDYVEMLTELYSMGLWTEYDDLFEEMRDKGFFVSDEIINNDLYN